MRKTYQLFLALMLTVMGATNAMGQKIYRAELDKSMFKAWDSNLPGAKEVADPEPEPKSNNPFACESNLYKEVGAYSTVFGSSNVYYLWYADLTGTETMYVTATPGMKIRVMLNREPYVEGGTGDADGGAYVELIQEVSAEGVATFDLSSYEYVHLNAIKVPNGSSSGVVRNIEIEGTVKPVTGILSMINNGDAEGDDLASFPVSWDGPNNGDTANDKPEIVGGGVNGSKCFKVTSYPDPSETWHTQFYVKADEVMPVGTKWKLIMSIKADNNTKITTSAQGAPRQWKGGFINEFNVGTEWKEYTWEGEISVDGFQSIAFDLNNGDERNADDNGWLPGNGNCGFYFDNIQFGVDLGGTNPMTAIGASYGSDVICVKLGDNTNMKDLVKAAGGKTLIFDNSCATVSWDGKNCNILSVEGRPDGNLYVFLLDMDGEGGDDFEAEDAVVKVGFKNPADAAYHLTFTTGKWEGQDIPDFSGIVCDYNFDLAYGEDVPFSYLWGAPELEAIAPEAGSFNLPADMKEFKVTFNQKVYAESVVAKLGNEKLTVSPAEGLAQEITLVRTGSNALNGVEELVISAAVGEKEEIAVLEEPITVQYSFGPIVIDPNDQPKNILTTENWNNTADGGVPAGYEIWFQQEETPRVAGNSYSSGARMFAFGEGGDFIRGLYFREGYVYYGTMDGYKLELQAGKKYNIHFNSAKWKSNGDALTFEIFSEDDIDNALLSETITPNPDVNGAKNAVNGSVSTDLSFTPEADGNYILKWSVDGYKEVLIANPTVKYVPNVLGIEEVTLLNTALENAKSTLEGNSDERYNGPAYNELDAAIKKCEAEKDGYTAPSVYRATAAALDAAAQALKDHRSLCDTYDPLPQQASDVVDNYADTKFAVTDIYATLVRLVAKYGEKKTVTVIDPDTEEPIETEELVIKELKDDAELTAAVAELKEAIALAVGREDVNRSGKGMFTVGVPEMGSWTATCTGTAVLVDRIRSGAETLKALGVDESDPLIVEADNALTDDDKLVEGIKMRIKKEMYEQLKNADNTLFESIIDENLEDVAQTYNMTVFAKNPSIYCLNAPAGYDPENIPGWDVTDFRGFSTGWGDLGTDKIPVGVMFSNWGGSFTASQTIEDLPAGVYTLTAGYGERRSATEIEKDAYDLEESFFFAATTELGEDTVTVSAPSVGQAFPVDNVELTDLVIADGKLTLGVVAGPSSRVFFNEVKLYMTAAADGFDYGKAYEEVLTGVEPQAKTAKVRAVQLFDLNGRRVQTAKKGIVIVKKYMSDGTISTEKVIK